jgi:hypothetical protein
LRSAPRAHAALLPATASPDDELRTIPQAQPILAQDLASSTPLSAHLHYFPRFSSSKQPVSTFSQVSSFRTAKVDDT